MYLTDEEKRILQGERGEVAQRCMVYLVEEGEVAGAERLVDIDGTCDFHVPHSAMIIHHSIPVELLQQAADRGERFAVPTFGNKMTGPGYIPATWILHPWQSVLRIMDSRCQSALIVSHPSISPRIFYLHHPGRP